MKKIYDISKLEWNLTGYTPYVWKFEKDGSGTARTIDVGPVKACVPGSVQKALLNAGIIEDWNVLYNARKCEWVENRHWCYSTRIPAQWMQGDKRVRLVCKGLDYSGWIYLNGKEIHYFKGTHIPHCVDITSYCTEGDNELEIIFDTPPRWLGQFGYTSRMTEWKTRYNYTWDWVPRLVQTGIWDSIELHVDDGQCIDALHIYTDMDLKDNTGIIHVRGKASGPEGSVLRFAIHDGGRLIGERYEDLSIFDEGMEWMDIAAEMWWPNLEGEQKLYNFSCEILGPNGIIIDKTTQPIGFKNVQWEQCEGAPEGADPWVCVVNGRPVFLQGVNFQPIRANFADVTRDEYEKRLRLYRELGVNMVRINACGYLELECFFELCDELGIMVWQELPLTSSGIDNWPPEDEKSIVSMEEIAASFIERRQHHVSLTMWSGGNELQSGLDGRKLGAGKPCTMEHPMLKRLGKVVGQLDPLRRYMPTSPSGPRSFADYQDFGKGLHWDVHGPYNSIIGEDEKVYWENDDALFRSELCCPGANPIYLLQRYNKDFVPFPATPDNPIWNFPTAWWNDWELMKRIHGREPASLEEYVEWSQDNQAERLTVAMTACKNRFPRCGGVLLWGSHDTAPIPINTTIIDYDGNPKPAALALKKVWRNK